MHWLPYDTYDAHPPLILPDIDALCAYLAARRMHREAIEVSVSTKLGWQVVFRGRANDLAKHPSLLADMRAMAPYRLLTSRKKPHIWG
jgi:hypothetical protein